MSTFPTCTAKHTAYQPTKEEWPDGAGDCEQLHVEDELHCYSCGYSTTGAAFSKALQKKNSLIKCPQCKGKGLVSQAQANGAQHTHRVDEIKARLAAANVGDVSCVGGNFICEHTRVKVGRPGLENRWWAQFYTQHGHMTPAQIQSLSTMFQSAPADMAFLLSEVERLEGHALQAHEGIADLNSRILKLQQERDTAMKQLASLVGAGSNLKFVQEREENDLSFCVDKEDMAQFREALADSTKLLGECK